MSSILDTAGLPSVTPSVGGVDAYQRIQTSPDMFGGAQGQATQRLGATLGSAEAHVEKLATLYNQISADDGYNQVADYINKRMYGDPNKPGADGQPDLGYMGLKGRAALDARSGVMSEIDSYIGQVRASMKDPSAIHLFDANSRRLRTTTDNQVGSHANGQFTQYTHGVNNSAAVIALNRIAAAPGDDAAFDLAREDLRKAYVREAQNGGQDSAQSADAALAKADRDALKQRALALGTGDAAAGMKFIKEHQKELGTDYPALYQHFEAKNDQQTGTSVGARAFADGNAVVAKSGVNLPVFAQAAQAVPGGVSPQGAARIVQIESGFRADPNPGGKYRGYVQAGDAYWQTYGEGGSRHNLADSVMALMRSTAADRRTLAAGLGRDPATISDGELYLAHQQGPAGALALLRNPNMPAADALAQAYKGDRARAAQAIRMNGGDPDAPAAAFVAKWTYKFGGSGGMPAITPGGGITGSMPQAAVAAPDETPAGPAPAPAPAPGQTLGTAPEAAPPPAPSTLTSEERYAAVMAQAFQQIAADPSLNARQREYAYAHVKEMAQTFAIMEGANERTRKRRNDAAADDWSKSILSGQMDATTRAKIVNDPRITDAHTRQYLVELAEKKAGETPAVRANKYGVGFQSLLERVVAPKQPEDQITSQAPLLRAYLDGQISDAGLRELQTVMKDAREGKTGDSTLMSNAIERTKRIMVLNSVKDPFLGGQIDDEAGQDKLEQFTHVFVDGLRRTIEQGKSVADYTDPKNVDKLIEQVYPRAERAQNAVSFNQRRFAGTEGASAEPAPSKPATPPKGVEQKAWDRLLAGRPQGKDGKPWPTSNWAGYLAALKASPTDRNIAEFTARFPQVDLRPLLGDKAPAPAARQPAAVEVPETDMTGAPAPAPARERALYD